MWCLVSIGQKSTDLVLEDIEQDNDKEAKQEKEVSLMWSNPDEHFQKDGDLKENHHKICPVVIKKLFLRLC